VRIDLPSSQGGPPIVLAECIGALIGLGVARLLREKD
jgi:hypothetical protein